jgi:ATP adenylyltransferase
MLEPGTLWSQITHQTKHALKVGALQPIPTHYEFVEQNGVRFLVRILANLVKKDEAKQKQDKAAAAGQRSNPFLPYEPDLFVADLLPSHLVLLNKYNVADHHVLIVTREFEDQETWLNLQDFVALGICLKEFSSLGFYNGGQIAGASQPHKHLQLVPLPLTPEPPNIPIALAIASATFNNSVGTTPMFPFHHAIAPLDFYNYTDPQQVGQVLHNQYITLLTHLGFDTRGERQSAPYNLLVTRDWMLIVPRSQEKADTIGINALGFAGTLFVRSSDLLNQLKAIGPMTLLRQVAIPLADSNLEPSVTGESQGHETPSSPTSQDAISELIETRGDVEG